MIFTPKEVIRLRQYLENGGFLHADDNYGMDKSFRREMGKVFPSKDFVELPPNHGIFRNHFNLSAGLPKIHEHSGQRPQALALFEDERIVVIYTFESDLGDGWEREGENQYYFRNFSEPKAYPMGINIIFYAMTH